jgi:hypothetical protein
MVVAATAVIVAAVEEEAVVAASTRVEPTLGPLLLPSRGSERRKARVKEIPRAVVEAEEEKLKNKSSSALRRSAGQILVLHVIWKKESSSIKKEMKKSYEKIKKDNIDELK